MSEICRAGQQAGEWVRAEVPVLSPNSTNQQTRNEDSSERNHSLWKTSIFALNAFDWMGLNHSMEKNLFYSKSTVLNANHIKKMPSH